MTLSPHLRIKFLYVVETIFLFWISVSLDSRIMIPRLSPLLSPEIIDAGAHLVKSMRKSFCVEQMLMEDSADPRESFMSALESLFFHFVRSWGQYFCLLSTHISVTFACFVRRSAGLSPAGLQKASFRTFPRPSCKIQAGAL